MIGAGEAGRSLAAQAVRAGHRVVLEDVLPSKLRDALAAIATEGMRGTLETSSSIADAVREADLVIDFLPDELESKLEIVCMVDRMAPPKTIIAMPTKTQGVDDLAACTYRADKFVALDMGETVRVVRGAKTSDETAATVEGFLRSIAGQVIR